MIKFTNCKINLGLDVVARRQDGYHEIVTCMYPIPWHDVVEAVPSAGHDTTLTVLGNRVDCPVDDNLVMKAYREMSRLYHLPPYDIVLHKIVPDGAGLGGGSADATYTLRLLSEEAGLSLPAGQIAAVAAKLGADCAFFAYDRPMMARGIGDVLTPIDIDLKGYTIIIAKPSTVSISTRQAYAGITPAAPAIPLEELLCLPVEQWQGCVKNDFETSIFPLAPEIARLKQHMVERGAVYASMSGSGASVYGIFHTDAVTPDLEKSLTAMPHLIHKVG